MPLADVQGMYAPEVREPTMPGHIGFDSGLVYFVVYCVCAFNGGMIDPDNAAST